MENNYDLFCFEKPVQRNTSVLQTVEKCFQQCALCTSEEEKWVKNGIKFLCVSEFLVAQWSSVGVNIFQTAHFCKLLAIRRFSYGKRWISFSFVSEASAFEYVFSLQIFGHIQLRVRRSVRCLKAMNRFTYFDDISIHIASDIDLGFCRQLMTFAKESIRRFMKNLTSYRI